MKSIPMVLLVAAAAMASDRISGPIDPARTVEIPHHTRLLARGYVDQGPVSPSMRMEGLTLFLKPSRAQRNELDQLLTALQDPASAQYHQWITPEDFAARFAISAPDAAKITAWLQSAGFHVSRVGRARTTIVFDGTASNVENAFHTGIHQYASATAVHYSNSMNPSVPAALADIIESIGGLDDFIPEPVSHPSPKYTNSSGVHYLAPGDLATIYDFASLTGIDGTGQKIVIAGESTILTSDISNYRSMFGLPAQNLQTILVPGMPNPGQNSALGEADLDLEESGAVAPGASFIFLYTSSAYNAVFYAIDQNMAPVINASFHAGCDATESDATMLSYQLMAQQAVTEGITWVNSSGDIGPAGCDSNGVSQASDGLAARFPADIPEVTSVGGTEFNEGNGTYWSVGNSGTGGSAVSYIPEMVWNDSSASAIEASSGGVSAFFAKPPWQAGPGVPNDGQRDFPDVAMAASAAHDPYLIMTNGSLEGNGGTSASSPVFSGVLVLLNQYLVSKGVQKQPGLGNANVMLYRLAQTNPQAFHDITVGNNIIPCKSGTSGCTNGSMGYNAGAGYDLCTGLGSVDVAQLAAAAAIKFTAASEVVLSAASDPIYETADASGNHAWIVTLRLTEEAGVATTVTGLSVDGTGSSLASAFPNPAIPALQTVEAQVELNGLQVPSTHTFAVTGMDASGRTWTQKISVQFEGFDQPSSAPAIGSVVNAFGDAALIAPNTWVAIKGANLAPVGDVRTWQGYDFPTPTSPMPTALDGVSATVNGKSAFVEYISSTQVNILTPPDAISGTVPVILTVNGAASNTATVQAQSASPSFFVFDGTHVVGTHLTGGDVGPSSLYPGLTTPAQPNEEVVLYANGFGSTSVPVVSGAVTQSGSLPTLPVVTIGGLPANVIFAGLVSPGLFQFNVVVPANAPNGDDPLVATYNGSSTQSGVVITVQN